MKLHQDINAFRVLIEDIHNKSGYFLEDNKEMIEAADNRLYNNIKSS